MEKQMDKLKENCPEKVINSLITMYSDAIEYFAAMDDIG